jgi:protein required for attachment to host cells
MKRACIAIVDVTRARICEYDERKAAGQELTEIADLVSPGRRHVGQLMKSELGGGRTGGLDGAHAQTTDDHRQGFVEKKDLLFAREIVGELDKVVRAGAFEHLVVVAGPRMLGELRKYDAPLQRDGLRIEVIERDLAWQTQAQLHDHLAQLGIIPPRQRVAAAR